jgi:hypothetical protein
MMPFLVLFLFGMTIVIEPPSEEGGELDILEIVQNMNFLIQNINFGRREIIFI